MIAAFAEIPGLRDQLDLRQHRVLMNDVEERAEPVDVVQLARERSREIEAEAVDVHLEHPIAQAVHDELQHARMHHVERVPAAGVVRVVAGIVRNEPVVSGVVDAAKAQRRTEVVTFGRMVVDDVENHLDAGRMQLAHHRLELVHVPLRAVAHLGREKADRVVAPIIAKALLDEMAIVDEGVNRHQLDRRDAEPLQMIDDRQASRALRRCRAGAPGQPGASA